MEFSVEWKSFCLSGIEGEVCFRFQWSTVLELNIRVGLELFKELHCY